jgi:hypothetical protein
MLHNNVCRLRQSLHDGASRVNEMLHSHNAHPRHHD